MMAQQDDEWQAYVAEQIDEAYAAGYNDGEVSNETTATDWYDDYGNIPSAYIADEVDEALAEWDGDYQAMLISMKQSRDKMNKMRIARGFFKGKFDGMIEEESGEPNGGKSFPSKGSKGKGSSKGSGGKKGGRRCFKCGRFDHIVADCPSGKAGKPSTTTNGSSPIARQARQGGEGLQLQGWRHQARPWLDGNVGHDELHVPLWAILAGDGARVDAGGRSLRCDPVGL